MKDEYDFSTGQRGRFFRDGATLSPSVYIDTDLLSALKTRADRQGVGLSTLVNALLRQTLSSPEPTSVVDHVDA